MAKLPVFQKSVGLPSSVGGPRPAAGATAAGRNARALDEGGRALLGAADAVDRIQASQDAAWVSRASGEAEVFAADLERRLESESTEGAPGHVDQFRDEWDDYINGVTESARGGRARRGITERLERIGTSATVRRGGFQAKSQLAKRSSDFATGQDGLIFAARQNPGELARLLEQSGEDLDAASGFLPALSLPRIRTGIQAGLVEAAVQGALENDDFAVARAYVEGDEFGSLMTAEQRGRLLVNIEAGEENFFIATESRDIAESMAGADGAAVSRSALHGSIIVQESGFDPNIVSKKGATGLMQLMPDTARDMMKRLGIVPAATEEGFKAQLKDPKINKALGEEYFDVQMQKYDGNVVLSLAAYNAGPGMVDDWINGTNRTGKNKSGLKLGDPRTGEITDAEFVAGIPFKETREYVPDVLARAGGSVETPDEIRNRRLGEIAENDPILAARIQPRVNQQWALGHEGRVRDANAEQLRIAVITSEASIAASRAEITHDELNDLRESGDLTPSNHAVLTKSLDRAIEAKAIKVRESARVARAVDTAAEKIRRANETANIDVRVALGDINQAELNSARLAGTLTAEKFAAFTKRLIAAASSDAEDDADVIEAKAQMRRDLIASGINIRASRGDITQAEINAALDAKDITPQQFAVFTKSLDSATGDGTDLSGVRAAIKEAAGGLNVYNTDDKNAVDDYYDQIEQSDANGAYIAVTTGIAPELFVEDIRKRLDAGEPGAFEVADQVLAQRPNAFNRDGGEANIANLVTEFRAYTKANFEAQDAATRASRPPEEREAIAGSQVEITKELADISTDDRLDFLAVDSSFSQLDIPFDIRGSFNNDFELAYREARLDGVSKSRAAGVAAARLDMIYRTTTMRDMDGTSVVMRFPPEDYYPAGINGHEYIREQIVADIASESGSAPVSYRLRSTRLQTETDIKAGLPPRYQVFYIDQNGVGQQLMGFFRADPDEPVAALTSQRKEAFGDAVLASSEARIVATTRILEIAERAGDKAGIARARAAIADARSLIPKDAIERREAESERQAQQSIDDLSRATTIKADSP